MKLKIQTFLIAFCLTSISCIGMEVSIPVGYESQNSVKFRVNIHEKLNLSPETSLRPRDGCFVEPNDPGPFEECKSKMFHEWEGGRCVDRTPQPPPPIIVENPLPPIEHRPEEVPPPNNTIEPPPAPAPNDNTLILLAVCFFFGFCKL